MYEAGVHMYMHMLCLRRPEGTGLPEAGITGTFEPPHMGTGNRILVLCKNLLTTKSASQASSYILLHCVCTNLADVCRPEEHLQELVLSLPRRSLGLNSGHVACRQVPLPTEPSYQPTFNGFLAHTSCISLWGTLWHFRPCIYNVK